MSRKSPVATSTMMTLLASNERNTNEKSIVDQIENEIYKGANVNAPFQDGNMVRFLYTKPKRMAVLVKHGAKVDVKPNGLYDYLIIDAIKKVNGDKIKEIIDVLLQGNLDIEKKYGQTKRTALLIALLEENVNAVKKLIASGANIRAVDADGNTALHCAAMSRDPKIHTLIQIDKLNPNAQNNYKMTPLMLSFMAYADYEDDAHLKFMEKLAPVTDVTLKDASGLNIYEYVEHQFPGADKGVKKSVKATIQNALVNEVRDRMITLIGATTASKVKLPDEVMMKIATMGLDPKKSARVEKSMFKARSAYQTMLRKK